MNIIPIFYMLSPNFYTCICNQNCLHSTLLLLSLTSHDHLHLPHHCIQSPVNSFNQAKLHHQLVFEIRITSEQHLYPFPYNSTKPHIYLQNHLESQKIHVLQRAMYSM